MSFLGKVAKFAVGGLLGGSIASAIFGKKKAATPEAGPVPVPTRNTAAEAAARSDFLARRRGVVANMITGARGAESGARGGTKLGS